MTVALDRDTLPQNGRETMRRSLIWLGDRTLNSAEYRRVEIVVYEALKKLAKRGTVQQTGQGSKIARWQMNA